MLELYPQKNVVYGLGIATFLTLFLVPTLYYLHESGKLKASASRALVWAEIKEVLNNNRVIRKVTAILLKYRT